jgi:2-polyprenyl-3-methyl-5-hydroxy-6-metoxy-1,4-benzoquinol methylase
MVNEQDKITASYTTGLDKYYMDVIHKKLINNCVYGWILDFGCGLGTLKKSNPDWDIINYDIIPEYSEVQDYRDLKVHNIICCHVLEHLTKEQIIETLNNFYRMSFKRLIIAQPMENMLSEIAALTSKKDVHLGHITYYKDINKLCESRFKLIKRFKVFMMTEVSVYDI